MLEFTKLSPNEGDLDDQGKPRVNIKTSFAITQEGTTMVATRFVFNKGYRLVFVLDGTVGDMARRVNNTCDMANDDFKTFSEIQFASLSNEDGG